MHQETSGPDIYTVSNYEVRRSHGWCVASCCRDEKQHSPDSLFATSLFFSKAMHERFMKLCTKLFEFVISSEIIKSFFLPMWPDS
jgi:hypothetical protein